MGCMPFQTPPARFPAQDQVLVRGASDVERRFMSAVYRWMTFGLALTALVAFSVASSEEARSSRSSSGSPRR